MQKDLERILWIAPINMLTGGSFIYSLIAKYMYGENVNVEMAACIAASTFIPSLLYLYRPTREALWRGPNHSHHTDYNNRKIE